MAGLYLHATSGPVTMSGGGTRRTVLQVLAPGATVTPAARCVVRGWGVAFQGTNITDAPVLVSLVRQTDGGSGLLPYNSTSAPQIFINPKNTSDPEAYRTSVLVGIGSAEPGPVSPGYVENFYVHPQLGYRTWYPLCDSLIVPNGGRLGFCITSSLTYQCTFEVDIDE